MSRQTIAHYRITAKIGEGGMGEVYRATDTRLDREVAIKVLPASFATDADRMARFEREAKILASLNHPNIAAIYGVEDRALVMELVEGPTLADRLGQGAVGLEEAIEIAKQIAVALEAAHDKGIVHRDLKPANVKVRPDGMVKVLDFGLAKASAETPSAPENSPTLTLRETQAGVILGTAAYMSPEQARGKAVDKRADIWAFGVILYEMLTGKRLFGGDTISDSLAAVLKSEPDWDRIPAPARHVVRRCLQKDPKQRMHDIADARLELLEGANEREAAPRRERRRPAAIPILLAAAIGLTAGIWWRGSRPAPELRWSGTRLGGSTVAMGPRISPDGQLLAFQAMVDNVTQVAVMKPESGNWTVLTHDTSRGSVSEIAWSHDGTKLYYSRVKELPRGIFSVPVLGGDERLVIEDANGPKLLPDGSLLVDRLNPDRRIQVYHFWPESGRLAPLKALLRVGPTAMSRVTRAGDRVIYLGTPLDRPSEPDHLYTLDLASEKSVRLAPEVFIPIPAGFALAESGDGESALFTLLSGEVREIVSVPLDGSKGVRTMLPLPTITSFLDVGKDGSVYLDQWERPNEVVRYSPADGKLEHIGEAAYSQAFALPDGRIVYPAQTGGRSRLVVSSPGKEPAPLVETQEETWAPATPAGPNQVAFLVGERSNRGIAVASDVDGRILRRFNGAKGGEITSMAAFADGKTIYYTLSGSVWAISAADGQPQKIGPGDSVTVDPLRRELIVRLDEREQIRLVRRPVDGGPDMPIRVTGDIQLVAGDVPLGPRAAGRDGRILVQCIAGSSWFWPTGVLDPANGRVQILNIGYPVDMPSSSWTQDGKVVGVAMPLRSRLWKFKQAAAK